MKFLNLTPELANAWDNVANHSQDAWVFHAYDWLTLTQANWDVESRSFLVEYEGKIVGIFPLELNRQSKSLKSTYMGLGGPALIDGLQEGVRKKVLKAMHEQAKAIALECESPFLEVLLSPLSQSAMDPWHINPLIHHFYEDTSTHTWMLDLKKTEEEIYNGYSDDARRSIKGAEKLYTVTPIKSAQDMDKFYEVHCETRRRTGVEPHPQEFFKGLYELFIVKNRAILWQANDASGEAVAFEVTGIYKTGALYWMGCCKNEHLDSGVNYLLQHYAIMHSKSQGAHWFENGEAFPNVREGKLHGLTLFKGKFGGELHRFYKGKIDFSKDRVSLRRRIGKFFKLC
jgi:lipid II:glycine glycyltransferase (peptidoglycan interpeptide bridge formation enzyme)